MPKSEGCGKIKFRISYTQFRKPDKVVYCRKGALCPECQSQQEKPVNLVNKSVVKCKPAGTDDSGMSHVQREYADTLKSKEKVINDDGFSDFRYYKPEDVKEFIRQVDSDLLEDWTNSNGKTFTLDEIRNVINKRSGFGE